MNSVPPLALRLAAKTRKGLARLASGRKRSAETLAAEAIGAFVAYELAIVERIERGLKQMREGSVVSHDEVMREARALLKKKRKTITKKIKRA